MPDNLKDRGPADRSRINVHESWEVRWWCKELGCTKQELIAAVDAVGVAASAVRKHLAK